MLFLEYVMLTGQRLQTRERFVRIAEQSLDQKKQHRKANPTIGTMNIVLTLH